MSDRPGTRWGLGARLLTAIIAVILVAAATAFAVASAAGPAIFHDHMLRADAGAEEVVHAEAAFSTAWALSLALALLAALATSALVSVFLTRRITGSLAQVRHAATSVAGGDYGARVPGITMGAEFEDLASAFNLMAGELGRVEQTRGRMLGDLAHEMRTPVATLDGYLEAMLDGVAQADETTLGMLREQVGRLARLTEDITVVTTAEEGRLSMHRRSVPVQDLLENAAAQAAVGYAAKGVRLDVGVSDAARRSVLYADPDRLGQVLTNLLDNALRHTPEGGRVTLSADGDGVTLRLRVADSGSGIPGEHLPYLFERFYRGDTARDRAHGGSGIGLAIVRSITRAHDGTVAADSPGPGQGATFTVDLPMGLVRHPQR